MESECRSWSFFCFCFLNFFPPILITFMITLDYYIFRFFFFLASKYPGKFGHGGRYYYNSDSSLITVGIMCLNYILPVWRKVKDSWFNFICGLFCFKISTASILERLMLDVGAGSSYLVWFGPTHKFSYLIISLVPVCPGPSATFF